MRTTGTVSAGIHGCYCGVSRLGFGFLLVSCLDFITCVADVSIAFWIVGHVLPFANVASVFSCLGPVMVCRLNKSNLAVFLAPSIILFAFEASVSYRLCVTQGKQLFHYGNKCGHVAAFL